MKPDPMLPSTPLDWMRQTAKLRGIAVWKPPPSLAMRARYVFLILAVLNAVGVVPIAFANAHGAAPRQAAAIASAVVLIAAWLRAYHVGRHRMRSAAVETLAVGAACFGVGMPHAALGVVYAGTFYTALFPDIRAARLAGVGNTLAFVVVVALTDHPSVPSLLSMATLAPVAQVLVMGGLIFSMGRMIERTERDRERAAALTSLGETLIAAREPEAIHAAGADAAMALAAPEGASVAALFLPGDAWELSAVRGASPLPPGTRIDAHELPAALVAASAGPFTELTGARAAALAQRLGAKVEVGHAIALRGEPGGEGLLRPVLVVLSEAMLSEELRAQLGVAMHQLSLAMDLERSQKALVRSERLAAIGKLAATVGHELRNPLAAIRSAAQFLKRRTAGASTDPRVPEFFDIIDREVGASNRILSELLDFARSRPLQRGPADLRALVEEVRQIVQLNGTSLVNAVPEGFPPQLLDRDQVRQVVVNLVQNAADAVQGEADAQIVVHAARGAGGVVLDVEDNGPGMPRDVAARAFEPLFTTKSKGTGLGLALVAKVAEAHRGAARIEERRPRGTRVVIELATEG